MTKFTHYPAYRALQEHAAHPIDLTKKGAFSTVRIEKMCAKQGNLKLFYPCERVDESILKELFALAEQADALGQMQKMQSGGIINKIEGVESENRAVLHTAMRDFFEKPEGGPLAKQAASLAYQECEKLKKFLIHVGDRFTDLVQIGIGGSDLGPRAIYLGLQAYQKGGRKVHFISNVDPDDAAAVLKELDLSKTLFVVVSKSGTTLETRTNEALIATQLKAVGLTPSNHFIAVTGKGSPMDDPARYLESFYIWDYVGGRYSVTSMVGGVVLAFAFGMDRFLDFLKGASFMDKLAQERDPSKNLPLLSALLGIWNRNFLNHHTCAIIPYAQSLSRFPAHLQQLDMESNGKQIDREGKEVDFQTGPIIWGEPGTNGQHSFYQLIHQGTTVVPIEMIGFLHPQRGFDQIQGGSTSQEKLLSNLIAQSIGLAIGQKSDNPNRFFPGNRPSRILLAEQLDPYTLGAILSYYEHRVAFQGFIWGINSFDQEGVQLGKVLAVKMTEQFVSRRVKKGGGEKEFPLGAAFLKDFT